MFSRSWKDISARSSTPRWQSLPGSCKAGVKNLYIGWRSGGQHTYPSICLRSSPRWRPRSPGSFVRCRIFLPRPSPRSRAPGASLRTRRRRQTLWQKRRQMWLGMWLEMWGVWHLVGQWRVRCRTWLVVLWKLFFPFLSRLFVGMVDTKGLYDW